MLKNLQINILVKVTTTSLCSGGDRLVGTIFFSQDVLFCWVPYLKFGKVAHEVSIGQRNGYCHQLIACWFLFQTSNLPGQGSEVTLPSFDYNQKNQD